MGAAAAALLLTVAACHGEQPADRDVNPPGPSEFSRLDEAGINRIEQNRRARLDLRSLPADLHGMPDPRSLGARIDAPAGEQVQVELVSPGETFVLAASTITFFAPDEVPGIITVDLIRPFDSRAAACRDLRANAQRFGWSDSKITDSKITGWCDSPEEPRGPSTVAGGLGPVGLPVSVTARVGDSTTVLQYSIHTDPDLLTPSERQRIREHPGTTVSEPEIPELAQREGESQWTPRPGGQPG